MLTRIIKTSVTSIPAVIFCCLFSPLPAVTITDLVNGAQSRYDPGRHGISDSTIIELTSLAGPAQPPGTAANDTVVKIYRKGNRFRIESTVRTGGEPGASGREAAMTGVVISDGSDLWMMTPMFGKTRLPPQELRQIEAYSGWWDVLASRARIVGSETVEGRQCYVIDNTGGRRSFFSRLWIDAQDYRLLRAEGTGQTGTGTVLVQFADFRDSNGLAGIPYTIQTYTSGQLTAVTRVQQVFVNSGLSDALFDPATLKKPSGAAGQPRDKSMK